ncbi:DNA repair protein RecO, partial [Intestinibacillus massiliensis]|nr:DNA repair protein RecO [Intestinibacillus massiliensis]
AAYGRRMVLLFSKKYGKISAGTSISEKGRNKSALAMRPFTYGRYELFKNRDSYNINGAEVLKSYYRIGEDVDKYMNSSYVLEFTEKLLVEEQPSQALFSLILDFFSVMEKRQKSHGTLVLGYEVKALKIMGV